VLLVAVDVTVSPHHPDLAVDEVVGAFLMDYRRALGK
jgi:hypothetical protein